MRSQSIPELLLPVGDMRMCLAAIHHGADAIYVGMPQFNARGRTEDFSFEHLGEMINLCHLYGVKVHVAFNIVIFERELKSAHQALLQVLALGPDALIVQDLGLIKMIKTIAPWQEVHGSTQMSVTSDLAIRFLSDLGISRFVLGRENSISDIETIKKNTDCELEVFIHGALCVAYSGQCFTSETIGGRSANRGQCAQSCRFEYDMFVDGEKKDLVDRSYLVSPQDLCGLEQLPQLMEIGVDSFKIEGRLKGAHYVAQAAKSYKAYRDKTLGPSKTVPRELISPMAITYSRGLYSGWLDGVQHQKLVDGRFGSNRGLLVGKILVQKGKSLLISSHHQINKGDGLLFITSKNAEVGSKVYECSQTNDHEFLVSFSNDFDQRLIECGNEVYLNSSSTLYKELDQVIDDKRKQKKIPVNIVLKAHAGEYAELEMSDGVNCVKVKSPELLQEAQKEQDIEKVKKEISSLGGSVFCVGDLQINQSGNTPFLPNKALKVLRKLACSELAAKRTSIEDHQIENFELPHLVTSPKRAPVLNILVRCIEQVEDLLSFNECSRIGSIVLDFEFGADYGKALSLVKAAKIPCGIATNRILRPGEYHHMKSLIRLSPDFILARNLGAVQFLKENQSSIPVRGDFSLNVTNSLSAMHLFEKGFDTLSLSYDLNSDQVVDLIENCPRVDFELTLHQYMPSFHMEHCVFAAFLSKGSSFKDCGKPCEKHKLELRDQFGNTHFIKADSECRNTMFNGTPQSASSLIEKVTSLGVREFRFEALFERGDELIKKISLYLDFLEGDMDSQTLKKSLGVFEKYGLSSGQLNKKDRYLDRKKR
ncbi:MAG: U32 family peptidase [Bacteriovoracaceae bacterium]|nr:U32 family peptidase [Bacteriovoracaceae bacterium]